MDRKLQEIYNDFQRWTKAEAEKARLDAFEYERKKAAGYFDVREEERKSAYPERYPSLLHHFSVSDFMATEDIGKPPIAGIFPRGDVSILAAKSGIGKSFLMLQLLSCVATGKPFLGEVIEKGSAVGLLWEDPANVTRDRMRSILARLEAKPEELNERLYLEMFAANAAEQSVLWANGPTERFSQLQQDLKFFFKMNVLVIDTAKIAFRDNIIDPQSVRQFLQSLRTMAAERGFAIILTTHTNRAGDTSGTTEWENHARCVVHLKPYADHFRLEVVKTNYSSKLAPIPLIRASDGQWLVRPVSKLIDVQSASKFRPSRASKSLDIMLGVIENSSRLLSSKKNSPKGNYGPRVAASSAVARSARLSLADLEAALTQLLHDGRIVEIIGPGKHKAKILAVANNQSVQAALTDPHCEPNSPESSLASSNTSAS